MPIDVSTLEGLTVSNAKDICESHGYDVFIFGVGEFVQDHLREGIILWTNGNTVEKAEKGF